ncbi:unnamed protein product [Caenorhabditis angaria]|uniref:Uncharacterized protein n=1 Tax=Caenorhabditis angaria TaxID=860376 RepID=A0A9P1MU68_9PELO|nr:unnamed protein product [Caenorhabditis angaria]
MRIVDCDGCLSVKVLVKNEENMDYEQIGDGWCTNQSKWRFQLESIELGKQEERRDEQVALMVEKSEKNFESELFIIKIDCDEKYLEIKMS